MTEFPALNAISTAANQGTAKTLFESFLAATKELVGAAASTELTIAGGSITPTRAHHSVDTEGNAVADDLTNIATTNTPDGRIVTLRCEDAGRVVTLKHGAGGAGQLYLAGAADFALNDPNIHVVLILRGTVWIEVTRTASAIGRALLSAASAAAARSAIGAEAADANIVKKNANFVMGAGVGQAYQPIGSLDALADDTLVLNGAIATSNRKSLTVDVDGTINATGMASGPVLVKCTNSGTRTLTITGATITANSGSWVETDGAVNFLLFESDGSSVDLTIDQRGA
jgi:hypothetical protein